MEAFRLNYDYRCPGTAILHDTVLDALDAGADWDISFEPFCLGQVHREEDQAPIWDHPEEDTGLEALQISVLVRDEHPHAFRAVHRGLFGLRHHEGKRLDRDNISHVLQESNLDPTLFWPSVDDGSALETVRREHTAQSDVLDVWGVPTFMMGNRATFVRFMERTNGDGSLAQKRVNQVLELMLHEGNLNEFKHTSVNH